MALDDFLKGELFASPTEALVACWQSIVGQPVDFKTDTLSEMHAGQELTFTFEVGIDIIVRVDEPGKGTVVAVRQTPKPVGWDTNGNPIEWEPS